MKDSVRAINEALGAMGEPPLSKEDVVQTRYVGHSEAVEVPAEEADEKRIHLLEPPGFRRCEIVFANGRGLLIDMQYEDLMRSIEAFLAEPRAQFLELPDIQVLGGDREGNGGVVVAVPMSFSRRALEGVQTVGVAWAKRVPGQEKEGGVGKVAVIRGDQAKQVLVNLNNKHRRQLERHN